MAAKKKEERLKVESLEEELESVKGQVSKLLELCLPPKEVRQEIMKNVYTIELSFFKIFKTLLDYQVSELEKKIEAPKKKAKKVEIE